MRVAADFWYEEANHLLKSMRNVCCTAKSTSIFMKFTPLSRLFQHIGGGSVSRWGANGESRDKTTIRKQNSACFT